MAAVLDYVTLQPKDVTIIEEKCKNEVKVVVGTAVWKKGSKNWIRT